MRYSALMATALAAALCAMAPAANAAVVLSDNFDALALGAPANAPGGVLDSNFNITAGSVDVIGQPNFYDFQPGHGRYIDLDGTNYSGPAPAGQLTSSSTFGRAPTL